MKQESEELMKRLDARELLAEVREFGYRPRQIKKSNGDALLKQESLLAKRIAKSKLEECLTPAELEEFNALPRKCRSDNSSGVQQPAATNEQQDDEHAQLSATRGPASLLKIRLRGKTSMEKLKLRLHKKTPMGMHCVADSQTSASAANTIAPSAARKRTASSDACNSSTARQRVSTTAASKRAASAMESIASTVPSLDAAVLQQVRDSNHYPHDISNPKTQNENDERKLCKRSRKKHQALRNDTLAEHSWCKDLRSLKQRLAEWKQQQVHIDSEAEQCYRELCRRIELMLSEPSRDMLVQERLEKASPSTKNTQKAAKKPPKKQLTDWWINASIIDRPATPVYCRVAQNEKSIQNKISLTLMHYLLAHVLLDDIRRFISDGTHLAIKTEPERQQYIDFFTACRDLDKREFAPWPSTEELQSGTSAFKPFVCFRHLALIEMVDKTFTELPHDHITLLQDLTTYRTNEELQCQVLSELEEKAVQRLIAYMKVEDNNFANARFLNLTEVVGAGSKQKVTKVTSELAAETSLRKMVTNLHYAFEKQNIDMTSFKPNQFAALSVYYAQFLTQVTNRTKHWLNRRYCYGLKQYVPGDAIEASIIESDGEEKEQAATVLSITMFAESL